MNATLPIRADQQGDPLDEDFPLPAERLARMRRACARVGLVAAEPVETEADRARADAAVMGLAADLMEKM